MRIINEKQFFSAEINAEELNTWIQAVRNEGFTKAMLFVSAQKRGMDDIAEVTTSADIHIAGGRFPGLLKDGTMHTEGMLLLPVDESSNLLEVELKEGAMLQGLDETLTRHDSALSSLQVFFDAFSEGKVEMVRSLYNLTGSEPGCIGGGAGLASLEPSKCILTRGGWRKDAAIIIARKRSLQVSIAHGWQAVSEPVKVTSSHGSRISTLNYEPAFMLYKQMVEAHSGESWNNRQTAEWMRSYPLGKFRLEAEYVVRDPFASDGNDLLLVDEIEEGEFVVLLNGDNERLLEGARRAKNAVGEKEKDEVRSLFAVDCISRALYLGERFNEELEVLRGNDHLCGALTIGELVNDGHGPLEIYNKTVALAKL